jgi:predicted XRE-type DNA-binding protein
VIFFYQNGGIQMTAKELVKTLMVEKDVSNAEMANALGITQAALWDRLNPKKTNNMTIGKLNDMLSKLGYELVVREKDGNGEYTLSE